MPQTTRTTVLFSMGLLIAGAPVSADVITIAPSRDVTFNEDSFGDSGNGSGEYLFAGKNAVGRSKRAIIHFDIASALPAGATVESVTLTMFCSRTSSGLRDVGLYPALADWGEGASNPPNNEGSGGPAAENDATWIYRFFVPGGQGPTWDTPGGDFLPAASAVAGIGAEGSFYSWSSAQMAADVQGWLDDATTNFGWFVVGTESQPRTSKRFNSRTHPVVAQRPALTVVFTAANPCPADVAEPFGVLDLADVQAFIAAFVAGDPLADIADPSGVLDLADVQAFIASFVAGCP